VSETSDLQKERGTACHFTRFTPDSDFFHHTFRESWPMEPLEAERVGGPEEAAVDEARVTDSPTRVSDSSERLSNARPASRVTHSAARVGSPADRLSEPLDTPRTTGAGTSTGVDTGAMPQTTEDQAAWDGSAMPISTGRDTDSMSIAVVAVTTEQSADLSSTGVGTALRASIRAYDDDGASSSGTERDAAQWKIVPQSSREVQGSGRYSARYHLCGAGHSIAAS